MKIKTQITETVEQVPIPHGTVKQVQFSKEVKKQKARAI